MSKQGTSNPAAFKIVTIGASVGGVEALSKVISNLPSDLNASVLMVMHTAPEGPGLLPQILGRTTRLRVQHAAAGQKIAPGNVYVAPPDHHLLVEPDGLNLSHGPKVNRSRPSVDLLFQSAAETYGARVIGIVLTGSLSDGAAGLELIKKRGGTTVVQDPDDAFCAEMPLSALRKTKVDYTVPVGQISGLLLRLTARALVEPRQDSRKRPFPPSKSEMVCGLACPECGGPLKEFGRRKNAQFRCRIGHAFSTKSLLEAHGDGLERSLWTAVQFLAERAELLRRVASRLPAQASHSKQGFGAKAMARKCEEHAEALRHLFEKK